jgi:radial spoke head protein 4A
MLDGVRFNGVGSNQAPFRKMVGVDERVVRDSAVWQAMRQTLSLMAAERPKEGVDAMESYIGLAQHGHAVPAQVTTVYMDARPKPKQALAPEVTTDSRWAANYALQVAPPKPVKVGEDGEPEEAEAEEDKGEMPDIITEQELFQSFGEGLSESEAFRVYVAAKRLLDKEPLAKVRFWGKIQGTQKDYYVVEAKIDENRVAEKEEAEEEQPETVGKPAETIYQALNTYRAKEAPRVLAEEAKGSNEFKYYVATSDDITTWVQLPDVLPSQIVAARSITKLFTGNLTAPVDTLPAFPGSEKHYLRAQIARISHGTLVCPKDTFVQEQPEEEEEEDEDAPKKPKRFEVPAPEEVPALNPTEAPDASDPEAVAPLRTWFEGFKKDELLEPRLWVHMAPQLLQQGRSTVFKPEDDGAGDEEGEDEAPPAPVEYINPFLADCAHDVAMDFTTYSTSAVVPWAVRKAYATEGALTKRFLIRSLRWPGAMCVAETTDEQPGATYQNLYVGRGIKAAAGGHGYCPPLPPMPCVEFPMAMLKLNNDCTRDDELEFEPEPPKPQVPGAEGEEEEEADE